jgi:hypothetical protein
MGWPQVTLIALSAVSVAIAGVKHGEPKGNWSFWAAIVSVGIEIGLLYAGGFFG